MEWYPRLGCLLSGYVKHPGLPVLSTVGHLRWKIGNCSEDRDISTVSCAPDFPIGWRSCDSATKNARQCTPLDILFSENLFFLLCVLLWNNSKSSIIVSVGVRCYHFSAGRALRWVWESGKVLVYCTDLSAIWRWFWTCKYNNAYITKHAQI